MKQKVIVKIESWSNKDGILVLNARDYAVRSLINNIVDLCLNSKSGYIQAELSPPYKKRTIRENDKWWAMCTEFGNHCGMTKDDVAMGVKWRAVDEGLWEVEKIPFTDRIQPKSTTKSNTKEMSILIDVLYRIASEDGYLFEN